MSSTIVASRMVASLQTLKGLFYALFEQTCASNDHPKTPTWRCSYFGTAAACMRRAITDAATTEGGILKEASGQVSPSVYIKHWRHEFAQPVALKTTIVQARFGSGFYDLSVGKKEAVASLLASHGLQIHDDMVTINLYQDPDVLQELIDTHTLPIWKFLSGNDYQLPGLESHKYSPDLQKSIYTTHPANVFSLQEGQSERIYWIMGKDGVMIKSGWAYSTIEKMVEIYASESELQRPGSAEDTIRLVRQAVKDAVPLQEDCQLVINRDAFEHSWEKDSFNFLAGKLQVADGLIATTIGELRTADALYEFTCIPSKMVSFPNLKKPQIDADLLAA